MKLLVNRRVVVTRADDQADALCTGLEAQGAEPVRCPTIRIAPPASFDDVDRALGRLADYDWVVFTSANGVRTALARAAELGIPDAALGGRRVAAVGRVTAAALAERGVAVGFVPSSQGASGLARSLPEVQGMRVLLAHGDKADPILRRILEERGALSVDVVTTYVTLSVSPSGPALEELRKGVDAITFTSPSTVTGFVSMGPDWRALIRRAVVATIGPTTTAAAMASGVGVHAEARERTTAALIDAVAVALGMGSPTRTTMR
jgi:uroporphyrinogen III methyltransferase/synthase